MIRGSLVALVTPFNEDQSVNYNALHDLIEFHILNKTDGLVVLGTTAEAATLSDEEKDKIVQFVVNQVNKRIPIIVGSGSNDTKKAIYYSEKYTAMGADFLLVVTPYYNKTNELGCIKHFTDIAQSNVSPIILYNVPSRTGYNMSVNSVNVLSKHKNIVGIKEASGDMSYLAKIACLLSKDFVLYSGNDDLIIPILSLGGSGVISVAANIMPRIIHNMCEFYFNGKCDDAKSLQLKYLDLINNLFIETNPIPVKNAMNLLGLNAGCCRMPLYEMANDNLNTLEASLNLVKDDIL